MKMSLTIKIDTKMVEEEILKEYNDSAADVVKDGLPRPGSQLWQEMVEGIVRSIFRDLEGGADDMVIGYVENKMTQLENEKNSEGKIDRWSILSL